MGFESLKENKVWVIDTQNYSDDCKKYFQENKIVMGLGDNINLQEYIGSEKEINHKVKNYLEKFLKIKKGDYITWNVTDRINIGQESYLQVNKVLGKLNQDLSEAYEYIASVGHVLPIQVLEKTETLFKKPDYIKCWKIEGSSKGYEDFKKLEGFKNLKNVEGDKYHFKLSYFGLESIEENDNELIIKLDNLKMSKNSDLEKVNSFSKGDYILGEFISKKDKETQVLRIIGKVKDICLEVDKKIILEIISKEKKDYEYTSIIDINDVTDGKGTINFINKNSIKSKNIIMYGPPGTGKTYSIDNEILKITDISMFEEEKGNREKIHSEVRTLQNNGRVKFCTFHQSYGYEEFIEGLRSDGEGNFAVEDGILKEIAMEAMFEGLAYELKADILDKADTLNEKELKLAKKEQVLKYINEKNRFDFIDSEQYVMVIDEINRGNISKIFGELLTLLEEDKRLTKENEVIINLPYSKEAFTLPPNLHLIGTMNSSDKSIAPIDIALRRRFKFIEVMPNERLLHTVEGIDLIEMLTKINARIEYLYDREHMIGHAYFINISTQEQLIETLKDKIVPLLQEYFYEDWHKIGLVLGGIGNSEDDKYIVYKKEMNPKTLFNDTLEYDFSIANKYCIKNNISALDLKSIYE